MDYLFCHRFWLKRSTPLKPEAEVVVTYENDPKKNARTELLSNRKSCAIPLSW